MSGKKLTVSRINRAIADRGIDARLNRGNGFFYFTGTAFLNGKSPEVRVYFVNDFSLTKWLGVLDEIIQAQ